MITRESPILPPPANPLAGMGRAVIAACQSTGRALLMLWGATLAIPHAFSKRNRSDTLAQLYAVGIQSLAVVSIVSLFTGMILALQVGLELARFNQENYLGAAVMLTLLREMAAFCCGICMAA